MSILHTTRKENSYAFKASTTIYILLVILLFMFFLHESYHILQNKDYNEELESSKIRKHRLQRSINDGQKSKLSTPLSFIDEHLGIANKYRALHGVPPLEIDYQLAIDAEKWAQHLAEESDKQNKPVLDPSWKYSQGENIFAKLSDNATTTVTGTDVAVKWYSGCVSHWWDPNKFVKESSRFTQMVWKDSEWMGIGRAQATKQKLTIVVARYFPAGNWIYTTSYPANVFPLVKSSEKCYEPSSSENITTLAIVTYPKRNSSSRPSGSSKGSTTEDPIAIKIDPNDPPPKPPDPDPLPLFDNLLNVSTKAAATPCPYKAKGRSLPKVGNGTNNKAINGSSISTPKNNVTAEDKNQKNINATSQTSLGRRLEITSKANTKRNTEKLEANVTNNTRVDGPGGNGKKKEEIYYSFSRYPNGTIHYFKLSERPKENSSETEGINTKLKESNSLVSKEKATEDLKEIDKTTKIPFFGRIIQEITTKNARESKSTELLKGNTIEKASDFDETDKNEKKKEIYYSFSRDPNGIIHYFKLNEKPKENSSTTEKSNTKLKEVTTKIPFLGRTMQEMTPEDARKVKPVEISKGSSKVIDETGRNGKKKEIYYSFFRDAKGEIHYFEVTEKPNTNTTENGKSTPTARATVQMSTTAISEEKTKLPEMVTLGRTLKGIPQKEKPKDTEKFEDGRKKKEQIYYSFFRDKDGIHYAKVTEKPKLITSVEKSEISEMRKNVNEFPSLGRVLKEERKEVSKDSLNGSTEIKKGIYYSFLRDDGGIHYFKVTEKSDKNKKEDNKTPKNSVEGTENLKFVSKESRENILEKDVREYSSLGRTLKEIIKDDRKHQENVTEKPNENANGINKQIENGGKGIYYRFIRDKDGIHYFRVTEPQSHSTEMKNISEKPEKNTTTMLGGKSTENPKTKESIRLGRMLKPAIADKQTSENPRGSTSERPTETSSERSKEITTEKSKEMTTEKPKEISTEITTEKLFVKSTEKPSNDVFEMLKENGKREKGKGGIYYFKFPEKSKENGIDNKVTGKGKDINIKQFMKKIIETPKENKKFNKKDRLDSNLNSVYHTESSTERLKLKGVENPNEKEFLNILEKYKKKGQGRAGIYYFKAPEKNKNNATENARDFDKPKEVATEKSLATVTEKAEEKKLSADISERDRRKKFGRGGFVSFDVTEKPKEDNINGTSEEDITETFKKSRKKKKARGGIFYFKVPEKSNETMENQEHKAEGRQGRGGKISVIVSTESSIIKRRPGGINYFKVPEKSKEKSSNDVGNETIGDQEPKSGVRQGRGGPKAFITPNNKNIKNLQKILKDTEEEESSEETLGSQNVFRNASESAVQIHNESVTDSSISKRGSGSVYYFKVPDKSTENSTLEINNEMGDKEYKTRRQNRRKQSFIAPNSTEKEMTLEMSEGSRNHTRMEKKKKARGGIFYFKVPEKMTENTNEVV